MGMCKWFFKDATKFQNGRQRSISNFFVGTKTLKLKSGIIQILLSHSPRYGDVQVTFLRFYWYSKWPPQINLNFCGGAKTHFFSNFNIIFLAAWGCASDFLKILPKFKTAARGQFQIFLWVQKLQNWKSGIITRYGDVQVIFLRFYWNSKWPPWINFIFLWAQKLKNWNQ